VASLIAIYFIVDWPDQASFLTADEKELIRLRHQSDKAQDMNELNRYSLRLILTDYKIWLWQVSMTTN